MSKSNAVHILILSVLLGASYFARESKACEKHQQDTGANEEAADCAEAEIPQAASDQEEANTTADDAPQGTEEPQQDLQSEVELNDANDEATPPTSDLALRGTKEPEEDLESTVKGTDDEMLTTVHPTVYHHSVQDAVPALKKAEKFYKELLWLVVTRAFLNEETRTDATEVVHSLVRLIFALQAIRTYIENVRSAWIHLKETVHHLVEDEKRSMEGEK